MLPGLDANLLVFEAVKLVLGAAVGWLLKTEFKVRSNSKDIDVLFNKIRSLERALHDPDDPDDSEAH